MKPDGLDLLKLEREHPELYAAVLQEILGWKEAVLADAKTEVLRELTEEREKASAALDAARTEAKGIIEAAKAQAEELRAEAQNKIFGLLGVLGYEAALEDVNQYANSGLTADQVALLWQKGLLKMPGKNKEMEAIGRAKADLDRAGADMLAAIQEAHGGPLPACPMDNTAYGVSPLVKDAQARAQKAKQDEERMRSGR